MAVREPQVMADVLLAALVVQLREDGLDADLCAKAIYPGALVPLDYGLESCGGQAFVRLTGAVPTTTFPNPDASPMSCLTTLAYTFELGVSRPSTYLDFVAGEANLPDDEEQIASAHAQYADMMAVRAAVKRVRDDVDLVVLGAYTPFGPDGGTVGGYWTVQVGMEA
jgi:hypothetical protein